MLFGSEGERALWEAVDLVVFGGKEPRAEFLEATRNLETRANCGQLLKRLRRRAGITPTEAAREAGVEPARWRHWEANAALLSADDFSRVCDVLALGDSDYRELLREHRRAPAAHFERVLRNWDRSSRRVARSTDDRVLAEKATGELDPALLLSLANLLCSEFGRPVTEQELAQALEEARRMTPEDRRAWIAKVVEFFEDQNP